MDQKPLSLQGHIRQDWPAQQRTADPRTQKDRRRQRRRQRHRNLGTGGTKISFAALTFPPHVPVLIPPGPSVSRTVAAACTRHGLRKPPRGTAAPSPATSPGPALGFVLCGFPERPPPPPVPVTHSEARKICSSSHVPVTVFPPHSERWDEGERESASL